jgi:hypothetical protein
MKLLISTLLALTLVSFGPQIVVRDAHADCGRNIIC